MKERSHVFVLTAGNATEAAKAAMMAEKLSVFTAKEILLVADRDYALKHCHSVIAEIPEKMKGRMAGIWLRSRLPHLLPAGPLYAYISNDADLAGEDCLRLFRFHSGDFTFSSIPLRASDASPFLLHCLCGKYPAHLIYDAVRLRKLISIFFPYGNKFPERLAADKLNLGQQIKIVKRNPWLYTGDILRSFYIRRLSKKRYFHFRNYIFDKSNKCWINSNSEIVMFDYMHYCKKIFDVSGFRYSKRRKKWYNNEAKEIFVYYHCLEFVNHLRSQTNVKIEDPAWYLWSPEVFTFTTESAYFFDRWSHYMEKLSTAAIWLQPETASLAAAAWDTGSFNQPVFPENAVLHADSRNADVIKNDTHTYSIVSLQKTVNPVFLVDFTRFYPEERPKIIDCNCSL
jgi:hypothetical protein